MTIVPILRPPATVHLRAIAQLRGDYAEVLGEVGQPSSVVPGDTFFASEEVAESLMMRGLAERYYERKMAVASQNKMMPAPANKAKALR